MFNTGVLWVVIQKLPQFEHKIHPGLHIISWPISPCNAWKQFLIHWGWATHIFVSKLTIIGSDNGLSPGRRQAIIWTNTGILLIGPLGTIFSEILIGIHTFSFKKMHLKMSSRKRQPFCLGFNVLMVHQQATIKVVSVWGSFLTNYFWGPIPPAFFSHFKFLGEFTLL